MAARLPELDTDHFAWLLSALDGRIDLADEPITYALYPSYLARAQLRFAAGAACQGVWEDLRESVRCLSFSVDEHLATFPIERFRSRRVEPLELAAASIDAVPGGQLAARYALPLSSLVAGLAGDAVEGEVKTVTRCLWGAPQDALDVAGFGALLWCTGLAAWVRGFEDEAGVAVKTMEALDHPFGDDPTVFRYERYLRMLGGLIAGDAASVAREVVVSLTSQAEALQEAMEPEAWSRPPTAPRYLDTAALAMLQQLLVRHGWPDSVGALPAPYGDLVNGWNDALQGSSQLPSPMGQ